MKQILTTIGCLISWLLNGLPFNGDWYTAFVICILIDVLLYINSKNKK